MGGRGAFSYSSQHSSVKDDSPLSAYAVASLNRGAASGTNPSAAIARFREQLMNKKVEYSAYLDDSGYFHALGSTGNEGSRKVAPLSAIGHETGVSTIVHNHPHGGSDGRKWGGPLSQGDLEYVAASHAATGGRINRIVATSNEGTYSARVTRPVAQKQVRSAARKADKALKGKKFQSEIAMWRAVNSAYTSEFAKIGINITFEPNKKKSGRLVTQKTGIYR